MTDQDVIEFYRHRLAEIERELVGYARLTAERDKLREMISLYEQETLPADASATNGRLPITQAVLSLIRKDKELTAPQIADRLHEIVITGRRDKRHAIIARISDLVKSGHLIKDEAGYILEPPPGTVKGPQRLRRGDSKRE